MCISSSTSSKISQTFFFKHAVFHIIFMLRRAAYLQLSLCAMQRSERLPRVGAQNKWRNGDVGHRASMWIGSFSFSPLLAQFRHCMWPAVSPGNGTNHRM